MKENKNFDDIISFLKIKLEVLSNLEEEKAKSEKLVEQIDQLKKIRGILYNLRDHWESINNRYREENYFFLILSKKKVRCYCLFCNYYKPSRVVARGGKNFEIVLIKEFLTEEELKDHHLSTREFLKRHQEKKEAIRNDGKKIEDKSLAPFFNWYSVPPWHKVVSANRLYFEKCLHCGKMSPLILHYYPGFNDFSYHRDTIYEFLPLCCAYLLAAE